MSASTVHVVILALRAVQVAALCVFFFAIGKSFKVFRR